MSGDEEIKIARTLDDIVNLMKGKTRADSARTVKIIIENNSEYYLVMEGKFVHGAWVEIFGPPTVIAPMDKGYWSSESDGIGTGTSGWVKYLVRYAGDGQKYGPVLASIKVEWDNPLAGSNSCSQSLDNESALMWTKKPGYVSGNHPVLTWAVMGMET